MWTSSPMRTGVWASALLALSVGCAAPPPPASAPATTTEISGDKVQHFTDVQGLSRASSLVIRGRVTAERKVVAATKNSSNPDRATVTRVAVLEVMKGDAKVVSLLLRQ